MLEPNQWTGKELTVTESSRLEIHSLPQPIFSTLVLSTTDSYSEIRGQEPNAGGAWNTVVVSILHNAFLWCHPRESPNHGFSLPTVVRPGSVLQPVPWVFISWLQRGKVCVCVCVSVCAFKTRWTMVGEHLVSNRAGIRCLLTLNKKVSIHKSTVPPATPHLRVPQIPKLEPKFSACLTYIQQWHCGDLN